MALERSGIKGKAVGLGTLGQPHFNSERVRDYRSALRGNFQAVKLVHLELLERGVMMADRGECSISTPMTEKEIRSYLTAFEESLAEVKPFIMQATPDLITK